VKILTLKRGLLYFLVNLNIHRSYGYSAYFVYLLAMIFDHKAFGADVKALAGRFGKKDKTPAAK
jgi:hypothetical protein